MDVISAPRRPESGAEQLQPRRRRVTLWAFGAVSDGLTALAQQQLARMAAGSGCEALLGYALSHVGHLELFTSSSTPCVYAAAA